MQYIRIKLLLCAVLSFAIICSVPMTAAAESAGENQS